MISQLKTLAPKGLYTIVNETIPIDDGGVSGVVLGELMEFAPDNTPKCVERANGFCALPKAVGTKILKTVYGFSPDLDAYACNIRVEFSIHPLKRGIHGRHTIIWETETFPRKALPKAPAVCWPNPFSKFLGDKAFGLLIAHHLELPVPKTTVISTRVAPFTFGLPTENKEVWMRACPSKRVPGKYPTYLGWKDPFELVCTWNSNRDKNDAPIVSIISQAAVTPLWSGSLAPVKDKPPVIEGVEGRGDGFMVGKKAPQNLPKEITAQVMRLYQNASEKLGPVEMEWVFDGSKVWLVQLHVGGAIADSTLIVPGTPEQWISFPVQKGLEALRKLIAQTKDDNTGIELVGRVGITSHFGHELLAAKIPARIVAEN